MISKKKSKYSYRSKLTAKQKRFCQEYINNGWNATRAYLKAYPGSKNENSAAAASSVLLRNHKVQTYIENVQKDIEKLSGISKAMVLNEHKKLAFSSIGDLHNTWITRKEFDTLTDSQKDVIQEISTKVCVQYESDPNNQKEKVPVTVEYVKVKLYDKQKALDSISKMLGYDAAIKIEANVNPFLALLKASGAEDDNKSEKKQE